MAMFTELIASVPEVYLDGLEIQTMQSIVGHIEDALLKVVSLLSHNSFPWC